MVQKETKKDKRGEKKKKVKFNVFLYYTVNLLLMLMAKVRMGYRVHKKELDWDKAPFLVLANHACAVDFIAYTSAFYPRHKLNYVVAENMSNQKIFRWFIKHFGAITRHQYVADFNSIKLIKQNLDAGISVLLFPEGKVTPDGKTGYIPPSIGKLVKWLKYPVVFGKTEGAYLCGPKWNLGRYSHGNVQLTFKPLLSVEDIERLSASEIHERIVSGLQYNDQQYQQDVGLKLKGRRLAHGLYKLLYKCPVCGAECEMQGGNKHVTCMSCGSRFSYGGDGIIRSLDGKECPSRIDYWYDFQRAEVAKEVAQPDFRLCERVALHLINSKTELFEKYGEGDLIITREGVRYSGEGRDGQAIEVFVESKHLPSVAAVLGTSMEMFDGEIYRFVFEGKEWSTKFALAVEEIYKYNGYEK